MDAFSVWLLFVLASGFEGGPSNAPEAFWRSRVDEAAIRRLPRKERKQLVLGMMKQASLGFVNEPEEKPYILAALLRTAQIFDPWPGHAVTEFPDFDAELSSELFQFANKGGGGKKGHVAEFTKNFLMDEESAERAAMAAQGMPYAENKDMSFNFWIPKKFQSEWLRHFRERALRQTWLEANPEPDREWIEDRQRYGRAPRHRRRR